MTTTTERVTRTFSSKRSLYGVTCPDDRPFVEAWHVTVAGFGVRVMAADAQGRVRRTYLCRYSEQVPDGKGGFAKKDRKERVGLVDELDSEPAISFDDAMELVLSKRRVLKEHKRDGGNHRMTVATAWKQYESEKRLNRASTLEKDATTYTRNLSHLAERFLDELDYRFWSQLVSQLKAGPVQVGTSIVDGKSVPDTRGPYANSTMLAILNVASNLYEIAHKYKGIKKLEAKENPARDAKKLVGVANKKRTQIPLKDFGLAWRASGQLVSPGFRDLFRVCVLTGLRRALLLSMKFSEIDHAQGIYLIDPRTPGTKRRGKDIAEQPEPIRLPLSKMVLDIIRDRREFAPDPDGFVWYSNPTKGKRAQGGVMTDPRASWADIEERIGRHFTPHDLRRTFATLGSVATAGTDVFALALLMLHSGSSLAAVVGLPAITVDYINTDEAQAKMRSTAEGVAAYAMKLVQEDIKEPPPEPKLPAYLEAALADD